MILKGKVVVQLQETLKIIAQRTKDQCTTFVKLLRQKANTYQIEKMEDNILIQSSSKDQQIIQGDIAGSSQIKNNDTQPINQEKYHSINVNDFPSQSFGIHSPSSSEEAHNQSQMQNTPIEFTYEIGNLHDEEGNHSDQDQTSASTDADPKINNVDADPNINDDQQYINNDLTFDHLQNFDNHEEN